MNNHHNEECPAVPKIIQVGEIYFDAEFLVTGQMQFSGVVAESDLCSPKDKDGLAHPYVEFMIF